MRATTVRQTVRHFAAVPLGLALAWAGLCPPASALAQQEATLQGSVRSEQGAVVQNASVRVDDTDQGTFVNSRGGYQIGVAPGTYTVTATALGYRPASQEVTLSAGETRTLDFRLQVDAVELGEIVTSVDAAAVSRREMGTDIATIDAADEVEKSATRNFSDLINARAGNVTVTQSSGNVGSGSRIRVRGINSLTQDNNPLLVIDGVRADQSTNVGINRGQTFSRFDDLNSEDIQSVEVVKGPSATALYGSEAAAGVIIVTTKRGEARGGAPRVTVRTEHGFQRDRADYRDNFADVTRFVTGGDDPLISQWPSTTHPLTGQVFVTDNPFEDPDTSPFRTARNSSASVSAAGGVGDVRYYSSGAYENSEGVLPSNDVERLNFRANFSVAPSPIVGINANAGYTSSTINLPKSGGNTSGFFLNAEDGVATSALGNQGDCLATVLTGSTPDPADDVDPSFCDKNGNARAAFDKIEPIISRNKLERFTPSANVTVEPSDWLTLRANVGADVVSSQFDDAIPFDPDVPFSFAAGGEFFRTRQQRRTYTGDVAGTADFGVTDDVSGVLTAGAQYFQNQSEEVACEGRVFPNDRATACDAAVSLRGFSDFVENVELGAFAQQRFNYRDYLFVTGAVRVDDNSALGEREDAIVSPSANASFVVSDLDDWNVDFVSSLRLRAAWGKASQSPDQFAADRSFSIVRLAQGGEVVAGLRPLDPGNPDLGAERSEEFELGFNAGLLDDRLGVDFTYFDRSTTDAIMQRPVPPSSGFANDQFVNVGELTNKGFEASVDGLVFDREDLSWDLRLNWSVTDPVVADVGLDDPSVFFGFGQVLAPGVAPGAYVSRVISDAERNEAGEIVPSSVEYLPGDVPGDDTGLRVVGQPTPTNTQSLSSTLTLFGDLQLYTLLERKAGHELYVDGLEDRNTPGDLDNINTSFGETWAFRQQDLSPEEQAMVERDRLEGNHNRPWIRDASFVKWRELTLSYSLPESFSQNFGSEMTRIFAGARELATFSDFPEPWDPESHERGARDNLITVVDNTLPPPLTVFGGVQLTF